VLPTPTPRDRGTSASRGFDIGYQVYGDPAGPSVLLMPTWPVMPARQWAFQVDHLARQGANIVVYDSAGNGTSQRTRDRRAAEFERVVGQAVDVLDHLGIERAHVAGFSRGVTYTLLLASTHPERVGRCVLIGGAVDPSQPWHGPNTLPAQSDDDTLDAFWQVCFNEPNADWVVQAARGWAREAGPGIAWMARYDADITPRASPAEIVAGARGPALILHGDIDAVSPLSYAESLASQRPDFELVVLAGLGHAPHLTAPDLVNERIGRFLGP
jgi:pimeloyl-ACP methyl ester carboxylesterase